MWGDIYLTETAAAKIYPAVYYRRSGVGACSCGRDHAYYTVTEDNALEDSIEVSAFNQILFRTTILSKCEAILFQVVPCCPQNQYS
jgi:hypothetical protein